MFALLQESPLGFAWLDPEIKTIADLVGKRIGGDQDSSPSIARRAVSTLNGQPAKNYEFVLYRLRPRRR